MIYKSNKASKLTLEKQSNRKSYPWLRILIGFGLLGGWIGANAINFMLFFIFFLLEDFVPRSWQGFDFQYFIENIFEGLGFKMIVGLFPALITAGIAIYLKLYLRTFKNWLVLGLLGFIVTIPFSIIALTMAETIDFELFILAVLVGLSGLFSALIIGGLTIPKFQVN